MENFIKDARNPDLYPVVNWETVKQMSKIIVL